MELNQLRFFLCAARHEHITNAAKELNISQPYLSNTISRLERELGLELFDRKRQGICLNEAGRMVQARAQVICSEAEALRKDTQRLAGLQKQTLEIASTSSRFFSYILPDFMAESSGLRFRQTVKQPDEHKRLLEEGKLDFCISSPPITGTQIVTRFLCRDEIFLVVPNHHRLANRESVQLCEAADEDFIALDPNFSSRRIQDEFCRQAGFLPKPVWEGELPLLIQMVNTGRWVCMLPRSLLSVQSKNYRVLKISEPVCERTLALSWRKDRTLNQNEQKFKQAIIDFYETKFLTSYENL